MCVSMPDKTEAADKVPALPSVGNGTNGNVGKVKPTMTLPGGGGERGSEATENPNVNFHIYYTTTTHANMFCLLLLFFQDLNPKMP